MKRSISKRIYTAFVVAGLLALAGPASTALADDFTLSVSAPGPAVAGKPMILRAAGTIPVRYLQFPFWFSLNAIPVSVTRTCPPDRWEGYQLTRGTGGANIVLSQREQADAAGNFAIQVGITPSAPGSVLLCGYTDDGLTNTMAVAALILNIQPASSTRPGTAAIRTDLIADIRSCRALLADSRHCIRGAIRRANTRCRKLRPRRGRPACLRAVRRVARSYT